MAWAFVLLLFGTAAANHPTVGTTCGGDDTCDDMAMLQMHQGSGATRDKDAAETTQEAEDDGKAEDTSPKCGGHGIQEFGLRTLTNTDNGQNGNYFGVIAKNDVIVQSLDVNLRRKRKVPVLIRVSAKRGSYRDNTCREEAWKLIGEKTIDPELGGAPLTAMDLNMSYFMAAGSRHAFHVAVEDPGFDNRLNYRNGVKYRNGVFYGFPVAQKDDNIEILQGAGTLDVIPGTCGWIFEPRIWSGRLRYKACAGSTPVLAQLAEHRDDLALAQLAAVPGQPEEIPGKRCAGESYTDDEDNGCAGFQVSAADECAGLCYGQVQAAGCPAKQCSAAVFYPDTQQCHLYDDCSALEEFTQENVVTYKI